MQVVGHPDLHGWDGTNPPMIGDIVAAVIQEFGRDNGGVNSSGRDQATTSTSWGGTSAQPQGGFLSAQPSSQAFGIGSTNTGNTTRGVAGVPAGAQEHMNVVSSPKTQGREERPKRTRQPKHHTSTPAVPSSFAELQGLSTEKLSRLLDDESARQALLLGMASVVQMKDLRTDVRKGNVELARLALSKQDTAQILREEGEVMKMELRRLQTSYEGIFFSP